MNEEFKDDLFESIRPLVISFLKNHDDSQQALEKVAFLMEELERMDANKDFEESKNELCEILKIEKS